MVETNAQRQKLVRRTCQASGEKEERKKPEADDAKDVAFFYFYVRPFLSLYPLAALT